MDQMTRLDNYFQDKYPDLGPNWKVWSTECVPELPHPSPGYTHFMISGSDTSTWSKGAKKGQTKWLKEKAYQFIVEADEFRRIVEAD